VKLKLHALLILVLDGGDHVMSSCHSSVMSPRVPDTGEGL